MTFGVVSRVRALWGRWWLVPLVPALFALLLFVAPWGRVRPEHLALGLATALLGFWGPRSKRFLVDIAPYIVVAIGYDLVRYLRPWFVTESRVMGCGLRQAELALFQVGPDTTFGEYLARHPTPALDLFFAVPYTVFVYVAFGYAAFLFFRDRPRMRRYLYAFAIANYISFACWLLFPAAPPWYVHTHGCAIDLATAPSPAGLSRVDALLGIQYFENFYSRAASIFGAMPSMHCAYPLLGLLTAWHVAPWKTRVVHLGYVLCMFLAALYLDHHWVLDAVAGWATALAALAITDRVLAWQRRTQSGVAAGEEPAVGSLSKQEQA